MASTSVPQAGSSWTESTAQAASTSSPQTVSSQTVSTNSQGVSTVQAGNPENAGSQAASTSQAGYFWAGNADVQAASTSPLAVSTISQGDSTTSPQAGSTQAGSNGTNSQGVSTAPPQTGSSRAESTDAQAASTSPQAISTNSQGAITTPPRLPRQIGTLIIARGPYFMVITGHPPNLEYIMAIELVCTMLGQQDAEELRAEINRVQRYSHPPKPNLTKAQSSAIRELKRDRDHIVLIADKGLAMVIMDRQDYINKSYNLLNQPTYRAIPQDPTNTIKNKLINILKRVKNQTGLDSVTYKSIHPTGCFPPNSMGSPKSTSQTHH